MNKLALQNARLMAHASIFCDRRGIHFVELLEQVIPGLESKANLNILQDDSLAQSVTILVYHFPLTLRINLGTV